MYGFISLLSVVALFIFIVTDNCKVEENKPRQRIITEYFKVQSPKTVKSIETEFELI